MNMGVTREEALTYFYLLLYIVLSSGQIFFNKWVLSSKEIGFPYPLGLTLLHMVFSSILCFIVVKVLKIVKLQDGMTPEIYIRTVFPIGAMFAMTLWLGNTAYLYISVAFAQMLKAIMPVAVFLLGAAAGLEVLSCKMFLIMSVISFGVLVASYGEIDVNWIGVVYQMGGVIGEALRLIFMEILVKRKGLKLNPITLMYYVSPCSAICLFIPWIFLEKPKMDSTTNWRFDPVIMSLNSLCTFALNEQLQRMEIDLRAQFIARADVIRIQTEFDEQTKQHASIVASLQEQLEQRGHHMHDLEQQLEERQRQLHVNQIETNEAVSQVWAKDGLLREQNNELATLRRECETALSEQKATATQLESERTQHLTELQDLKEQLHEKEREIHEMEEQRRTAQEMLLYKDDQLRETQTWLGRLQEMDAIHVNNTHNLQVELRDRIDQFNQLWLNCQRQLADQERYYLQSIQHLQIELAEAREQSQISKDNASLNQTDSKEKKPPYSENKGGSQYNVNGDAASKATKNGSTLVLNNQAKAGMIPNGNVDGATPLILVRDLPAKVEHAAGLPVSPSPVFGMGAVLPSDPMGMMHPFGVHQQSVPQSLQPPAAQVPPPPFGQFQSASATVTRQEVLTPQHQQPIHQTHNYIHQNQPSQVQRFPPRQQSHPNYQVNMKSQVLHSKHQDLQTHSQHEQIGGDMVDMQKEQQAQKPKEENQEQNLSSIIQQEYSEHHHQPQEGSGLQQLDQACQQDPQAIPIHSSFQPLEQSRRLEQQQLPSFSQHQIKQSKTELGTQDMEYESQHVTHSHNKSMNVEQLGPISRAPVSASPSPTFGGSSHFHQSVSDCKPHSETGDIQSSPVQSPQKSLTLDGYGKVSDPAILDERSLLGCFVRAIPAEASARIKISTTLPNRLGKMLAPLHWHDYKKQYGRLDEFVASHPELFIIEGDFIHLREGAHATISATTAVAKVAAAAAAAASPFGTARMPTIAVTPVAQSQMHRLRKGIFINSKDAKGSSLDPSSMVQMVSNSSNQYTHLHGGMLKQSQSLASRTSVVNGSIGQNPEVNHGGTENLSANSKEDVPKADGLSINTRLDGLAINSNTASAVNFDKAVTNGYKNTGSSNGRIGVPFGRQGRFPGSGSYIKQEFVNRPQTQESRITRIDPTTAPIR